MKSPIKDAKEEFVDSFIEAGFIIAYELDNAISQAKKAQNQILGKERTIILEPDRRTDESDEAG